MESFQADLDAIAKIEAVPTILEIICRVTGTGLAAVARVTEDRWIACGVRDEDAFGMQVGDELDIQTTFCRQVRSTGEPVIINNAAGDEVYCSHPIPAMYGIRSYISVPIRRGDGSVFGTLCAIGQEPAAMSRPEVVGMLRMFADLIGFHLDAREQMRSNAAALLDARQASELREQFMAVLGHDLRNPLASVEAGVRMLKRTELEPRAAETVSLMGRSVRRMAELIDNVLDLARGRLGGGLVLKRDDGAAVEGAVQQAIAELRAAWPGRRIDAEIALDEPLAADSARMAQLVSNLLANALAHGPDDKPVTLRARTAKDWFELVVANRGAPIPPEVMDRLFEPFFRTGDSQGLGLGLYIASEIARAHGGRIDVASTEAETRFTVRMPVR